MLESKEIRKMIVDAHVAWAKESGAEIKMSYPPHARVNQPEDGWRMYFDALSYAVASRVQEDTKSEIVAAREVGMKCGRAEVVTRGDGVPYTPPETT